MHTSVPICFDLCRQRLVFFNVDYLFGNEKKWINHGYLKKTCYCARISGPKGGLFGFRYGKNKSGLPGSLKKKTKEIRRDQNNKQTSSNANATLKDATNVTPENAKKQIQFSKCVN